MNRTNEAVAATATATASVAWGWVDQAHHVAQVILTFAGIAWWIRLWIRDARIRPPSVDDHVKIPCLTVLLAVGVALVSGGCAFQRPTMRSEERTTNGAVRVTETASPSWALWPATSELARQRISNGKTQSIGTEGLNQDGGGTNVTDALRSLDSILSKIRP